MKSVIDDRERKRWRPGQLGGERGGTTPAGKARKPGRLAIVVLKRITTNETIGAALDSSGKGVEKDEEYEYCNASRQREREGKTGESIRDQGE